MAHLYEEKKRVMELCHNELAGLRNFFFPPGLGISSTEVSS